MKNSLNWFEIPANDFQRAVKFYSELFDFEMPTQKMGDADMGFLPAEEEGVGGAIVRCKDYMPSKEGSVVYLNGGEDLQNILDRVEEIGGQIEVPKFEIPGGHGHCAFFIDTEGNRVGLHSQN